MLSLRAVCVALSSFVVYSSISFLTGNTVSPANARPESQASGQCVLDVGALCCDEVTTVRVTSIS